MCEVSWVEKPLSHVHILMHNDAFKTWDSSETNLNLVCVLYAIAFAFFCFSFLIFYSFLHEKFEDLNLNLCLLHGYSSKSDWTAKLLAVCALLPE